MADTKQLSPGPELDDLVGRKVMGFPEDQPLFDWHPSTSIADAFGVVAAVLKGQADEYTFELSVSDGGRTAAKIWDDGFLACEEWSAESTSHAICLAALEAVEHQDG